MPRIAEPRQAAEPHSPGQKARRERILRAAAHLGAEHDLEHVQMHEVAREAEVAIATLYRYFPSKTHLFTALLASHVDRLGEDAAAVGPTADPVEAVVDALLRATRHLVRQPRLARAMLQSNNAAHTATISEATAIERRVLDAVLGLLGLDDPTEQDERLVGLLMKCWHGVLVSALSEHSSTSDAEAEIRLACRVLLASRSNAR
ncbi:TetR family transcriptional regulator [Saccharopolyspora cebuensis]|uniref:TetR family transcriptional regulator n=1 Tax=Saccharopolyspora cebuensis TaxID=418759 RepID=A0ABV4CT83_9PSEU